MENMLNDFLSIFNSPENIIKGVEIVVAVVAIVISISSNVKSRKANKYAKKANELAEKANELAKEANTALRENSQVVRESNKIAKTANDIANTSNELALKEQMTDFNIEITDFGFTDDSYKLGSIDEVIKAGAFYATFSIENISNHDVNSLKIVNSREYFDSNPGTQIKAKSTVPVKHFFHIYEGTLSDKPTYAVSKNSGDIKGLLKRSYSIMYFMIWKSESHTFSSEFKFEFTIEEVVVNGQRNCRAQLPFNTVCSLDNIIIDHGKYITDME